jgi:hypothetical protein
MEESTNLLATQGILSDTDLQRHRELQELRGSAMREKCDSFGQALLLELQKQRVSMCDQAQSEYATVQRPIPEKAEVLRADLRSSQEKLTSKWTDYETAELAAVQEKLDGQLKRWTQGLEREAEKCRSLQARAAADLDRHRDEVVSRMKTAHAQAAGRAD